MHKSAIKFGVIHFLVTLGLAFLIVAEAASGMSDSDQGKPSGEGALIVFIYIFQAPVAIIQWLAMRFSPSGQTGCNMSTLLLIAAPSSLGYGYLIGNLIKRFRGI